MLRIYLSLFAIFLGALSFAQPDTTKIRPDSTDLEDLPMFSLSADDLESESQNQDVSSMLQSSRDVYVGIAGYNFSAARYRIRGYGSEHFTMLMNGIPMNDPESGWAIWAYWGGLNDITRYPQSKNGISTAPTTFGSIGGYSNMNLRASSFRKGTRFSYAISNRSYRNRPMLTHSTGVLKNGWAFTVSGSARWSDEGYVDGTYYSSGSYFFAAEKKFNSKHSINIAGFGAPTVQARQGIAVQETYDLTGNNFYNPYWGYQNDGQQKRNARVRNNHRPSAFITHDFRIDEKTSLETTAYGTFGRTGNSNLNWYDAPDPRPDYYRYLPSYHYTENPAYARQLEEAWMNNDPSATQIDWDGLYNANYKNLYTLEDANGIEGNDETFNRSKYVVEEYRLDPRQIGINSALTKQLSEKMNLKAGVHIEKYKSKNFKVLKDLLGGDYWVDVDQFAERDFPDPSAAQNNLDKPNQLVSAGDEFGYNYEIHNNSASAFGQVDATGKKIDWYAGATVSMTEFWRNGIWANGRFPEESKGESEHASFFNYGVKGGLTYKISGRHFVNVNGLYQTKAPSPRNSFISPRFRNAMVDNLESMDIFSGDINYQVRFPNIRGRATLFCTQLNNQTWARSFYHDEFRTFINYVMTGVDHLHMGAEVGLDVNVTSTVNVQGAFTTGQYLFNSRPTATITRDNSAELIADDRTVYLKNYKIGGMPQSAASIGVKYNSPKYWYVGVNANYFWDMYLSPNPDRRTEEAVSKYIDTDPQVAEILGQTKLDNGYVINIWGGKSWKIKEQFIRVNANINNVLNTTDFRTGGFEQLRYDSNDIDKFPPKYGYMYGTTYFIMLTYIF